MTMIASRSSTTASVRRKARSALGRLRPTMASTETANAMSVAVGTAHPLGTPPAGWPPGSSSGSGVGGLGDFRAAVDRAPAVLRRVEPVAHVADGADELLVLRAELGAEATHVHVDRAGAPVVVVAPDLLQQ